MQLCNCPLTKSSRAAHSCTQLHEKKCVFPGNFTVAQLHDTFTRYNIYISFKSVVQLCNCEIPGENALFFVQLCATVGRPATFT